MYEFLRGGYVHNLDFDYLISMTTCGELHWRQIERVGLRRCYVTDRESSPGLTDNSTDLVLVAVVSDGRTRIRTTNRELVSNGKIVDYEYRSRDCLDEDTYDRGRELYRAIRKSVRLAMQPGSTTA